MNVLQRRTLPAVIFLATCFGVFVFPFFFPLPPARGLSAANVAGFNNKIASVVLALIGLCVFVLSYRFRWFLPEKSIPVDTTPLSRRFSLTTTVVGAAVIAIFSCLIVQSKYRYTNDAYYFVNQASMYADFGRKLYDQIEFPYGPLIFYGPVVVRALLSPFHITMAGAYFITLVLEYCVGLGLVIFLVNGLPIVPRLKAVFVLLCAIYGVQPNFGINYTYLRFCVPAACLLAASRARRPGHFAAALFFGQIFCLAISPEMAFAFLAAGTAYALWYVYTEGPSRLLAAAAPLAATPIFLVFAGSGYVRMLGLFAHGYLNLIIEPLPHVLLFLYAFVWLVPPVLGLFLRERLAEAPLLVSLYVLSLALLPAALGGADPGHVFFNGITLYALAMVAVSQRSSRYQTVWSLCFAFVVLWSVAVNLRFLRFEYQTVIRKQVVGTTAGPGGRAVAAILRKTLPHTFERQSKAEAGGNDHLELDIAKLQQITGDAPVATPIEVPLRIESALRQSGQYVPSFYCFFTAIIDHDGEARKVEEMNASRWALLPYGAQIENTQTPESTGFVLGITLPYRQRNPPYIIGRQFNRNLADNWVPWARIGPYELYKQR